MMTEVIDVGGDTVGRARPVDEGRLVAPAELDFDAFCRREYASVAGLAYVLTGSWTAAEDLTQDAFFAAFRRWEHVHRYERPEAWVRRVVANRAVSWWRRVGSETRALARLQGRRPTGPQHAEIPERDAELWAIVRKLPGRQAQVFALTYVDDLPLAEVALVLDISPETAKTHLKRARRSVAQLRGAAADRGDDA